jgi:tetratricopeptide (TPR) repeat protein
LTSEQIEAGIRLAWALTLFWYTRGYWMEGRERTAAWMTRMNADDKTLGRMLMLGAASVFTVLHGDSARAHRLIDECLTIVPLVINQSKHAVANFLPYLGMSAMASGDYELSRSISEQALALGRETDNGWVIAAALERLALCAMQQADYAAARKLFEEGIAASRKIGDEWLWSVISNNLSNLLFFQGEYVAARTLLESSIAVFRKMGDNNSLTFTLGILGMLEQAEGNDAQARASLQESIDVSQKVGHHSRYLWSRVRLGYLLLRQADLLGARAIFSESVQDFQNDQTEIGVIYTLEGMASLEVVAGNPDRATRLFGWADAARITVNDLRPPHEQADVDRDIVACRLTLGEVAFADAYVASQVMTMAQAVAYALEANEK